MFATAITCIDGRIQSPINDYIRNKFIVGYVDTITLPGVDKILAENTNTTSIESIRKGIDISVFTHGSKLIAITGHYDCATIQVDKETHMEYIKTAVEVIEKWGYDVKVIGLWINKDWQVKEIV